MSVEHYKNPYQILQLGTKASFQEVMERSKELAEAVWDRNEQAMYRDAALEIRQHPVRRARNQFWEPPETCYKDDILEEFCDEHEGSPFGRSSLKERADRFVEKDCSCKGLAHLALPPIQSPPSCKSYVDGIPLESLDLPLEPWEIFYV